MFSFSILFICFAKLPTANTFLVLFWYLVNFYSLVFLFLAIGVSFDYFEGGNIIKFGDFTEF